MEFLVLGAIGVAAYFFLKKPSGFSPQQISVQPQYMVNSSGAKIPIGTDNTGQGTDFGSAQYVTPQISKVTQVQSTVNPVPVSTANADRARIQSVLPPFFSKLLFPSGGNLR